MADDDYEATLLVVRECFVYRVPPRTQAKGFKAADWDLTAPLWQGRTRVVSKGPKCIVKLEDPTNGEVFAQSIVDDTSVEPVTDSSRYFVLKIEDGTGRHAFIGLGFAERTEAFDFSAALQDHKRHLQQEQESAASAKRLESMPHVDYSLKEGQKIHVSIKTNSGGSSKKSTRSGDSGGFGGGLLLPPPPGSKSVVQQQQHQPSFTSSAPSSGNSLDALFSTPSPSAAAPRTNAAPSNDLWGDLGSFGGAPAPRPAPTNNTQNWNPF
jgi:hypothetical protein